MLLHLKMIPIKYCNAPPHTIKESLIMTKESRNLRKARRAIRCMNPNSDAQMIINEIRQNIPNSRLNNCKYLAGVTRMYLNNELYDYETIGKLNQTLKLLATAHADEYDNNLNGIAANELIERFRTESNVEYSNDVKAHNSTQFIENKRYKIYRVDSFEKAKKFSPYTSWCVTKNEESYNSYTGGGTGLFYFCIRDDFKMTNAVQPDGCPLNDYGLSMIATSVDDDGRCNTITCRWNHDNNGNDGIMTPMQLSKLIGRNYYQVFKPYTKEELYAKGLIPTEDVQMLLDKGKKPNKIFSKMLKSGIDGILIVSLNENKWNLFDTSKNMILCSEWYGYVGYFHDGFAVVRRGDLKCNFIKPDGKLLCSEWYDYVSDFKNGFAVVIRGDGKWNFIKTDGSVLCDEWYDYVSDFKNGFAFVRRGDGKCNLIKPDGSVLCDEWYDLVYDFENGFAFVRRGDGKWNFIKSDGSILSSEWYKSTDYFYNGFARVQRDDLKWNFIKSDGSILCSEWYKTVSDFKKGVAKVQRYDGKYNFIKPDGTILYSEWSKYN